MRRWKTVAWFFLLAFFVVGVEPAVAGPRFRAANGEFGGGGAYINLIVREVRVTPIVAHAGDIIRIEVVMENRGENANITIPVEILANKKVVAKRLFTFGWGDTPGMIFREAFEWNTKGISPGEYRIRGEVHVWEDASPFDNFLDVEEPLVLLPAGASLPAGKEDGGTAVAVDPRWRPAPSGDAGKPAGPGKGY